METHIAVHSIFNKLLEVEHRDYKKGDSGKFYIFATRWEDGVPFENYIGAFDNAESYVRFKASDFRPLWEKDDITLNKTEYDILESMGAFK